MKKSYDEIAKLAEVKLGIPVSKLCITIQGDRLWVQRGLDTTQKYELKDVELDLPVPSC